MCYAGGFRDGKGYQRLGLTWAVAVVLAESNGNGSAVNQNTDGTSDHGYFQWNTRWHPEGVAIAGQAVPEAQLAMKVSNAGATWSQWSTFNNGQAAAQLGRAGIAVAAVNSLVSKGGFGSGFWDAIGNGAGDVAGAVTGAVGDAAGAVGSALGLDGIAQGVKTIAVGVVKTAGWVGNTHNWVRILEVVAGLGLVAGGLALVKPELLGALGPEGAVAGAVMAKGKATPAADAE